MLQRMIVCAILVAAPVAAATCDSLANLKLANTHIATSQAVEAGAFTPPGASPNGPGQAMYKALPAFCRVTGSIKPSSDSDIEFEVWLPASGWNGKFEGVGNGGFAGVIGYAGLAASVSRGYAAASTDTGHRAVGTDATWALGHPEKVADFGYRAIHETAVQGKAIAKAFYGDAPKRSYFNSCSNGGRQALMEAQRYPGDYDGIIAGAPAYYWTHLFTNAIWVVQSTMADSASYIPASKLPAIEAAALAACDANDGVKDGVIDSPNLCQFKPATLLCKDGDSDACLTQPQVKAVENLLAGPKGAKEQIFPGYVMGGVPGGNGWGGWITGAAPGRSLAFAFGTNFFANMVFEDKAWDWHTFRPDRDSKVADDKVARLLNATDPDLGKFQARGGKLILYHGWSDAGISPLSTIDYYKSVQATMGKNADSFVRLFMVPGMQHCAGGPGPADFGQGGAATGDAEHDINSALERWVETGTAPARIIATKVSSPGNVERTRPLCPYPQTAKYKGTGSTDDAANFECK
jgi:tannase/feruloyl esterase